MDDIQIVPRTTIPPTPFPTFSPTKSPNTGPTSQPTQRTDAPTTNNVVDCPPAGASPTIVGSGAVIFGLSKGSNLCSLDKEVTSSSTNQKTLIPIALSYEGNPWEQAAGEHAQRVFGGEEILCYLSGCQLNLPELQEGESYVLSSSSHVLSKENEYARFLETATFGITEDDLESIDKPSINIQENIATWISKQMNVTATPMSSHREFWRKRLNGRVSYCSSSLVLEISFGFCK